MSVEAVKRVFVGRSENFAADVHRSLPKGVKLLVQPLENDTQPLADFNQCSQQPFSQYCTFLARLGSDAGSRRAR